MHTTTISQFRSRISDYFSQAVWRGRIVEIARGERERGFFLGHSQLERLVEGVSFNPELMAEEDSVSIWLPELDLWGEGETFADAKADLLTEVREYVDEYLGDSERYLAAPNRAHHFPVVLRALLADRKHELADILFAAPEELVPREAART